MYHLNSFGIKIILFLVIIASIPLHVRAMSPIELKSNLKNISHSLGQSINQKIATTADGHIYLVWSDADEFAEYSQIFFSKSNDSGKTFSEPLSISSQMRNTNMPVVTATGDKVYIAWEENSGNDSSILFRKSNDSGITFGKIINLSKPTIDARFLSLSANENNVYAVWRAAEGKTPKNFEIFFSKSTDYGESFENILNISKSSGDSLDPQITIPKNQPNYVYVSWSDCIEKNDDPYCSIYFAKSIDNGLSFGTPALISMFTSTVNSPFIGDQKSKFHSNVLPILVTNTDTQLVMHNSLNPQIITSIDGKYIYILWEDDFTQSGLTDIFLKKSNDYGKSFSEAINISNSTGISRIVKSTVAGNNLYIIWADTNSTNGNFGILFKRIIENGKIIGDTLKISKTLETSVPAGIAVSDDLSNVYVVWSESKNNQFDIFSSKSNDGGVTFSTPMNLSFSNGNSVDPIVSVNPVTNSIGIAWCEDISSNHDIYYLIVS